MSQLNSSTMNSTYQTEHIRMFEELKHALKMDMPKLALEANGGRSILFVYPPRDDEAYIAEAIERFSDSCEFIDLRSLLTEFMNDMGLEEFTRLKAEIGNEIYASNNYSEGTFYALIVKRITEAMAAGKIPVLIHTGTIYGMGFSNNNIMEEKVVLSSRIPLVVFYPATVENGTIKFLGKQNASKYRCIVIQ